MFVKPTLISEMSGKWQQNFAVYRFRKIKNRLTADVALLYGHKQR